MHAARSVQAERFNAFEVKIYQLGSFPGGAFRC